MTDASTAGSMSPGLLRVVERARQEPEGQFHSLAHLIDVECLERAYRRLRADAAVGVDGVSKEQYGQELRGNLEELHQRMKAMQYRHQPILRVHVPKESRGTRPIGISATEDKVVQGALTEVLAAIYEQDFLPCSFGFRPGRSAHDAIRVLNDAIHRGEVNWILEADIKSFFDSVDRTALEELLRIRVADGSLLRLVGKCLHVGVLEGEQFSRPDEGTPQGSVISPILGNVYLHYALDLWFERDIRPRLAGRALLVRYADDFVMGFERQDDAERVMAVLGKRLAKFGLILHPDKTRLLPFGRPPKEQQKGKGPGTFDFLGFTLFWVRSVGVAGSHAARPGVSVSDAPSTASTSGAAANGSGRCQTNTPRSRAASKATSTIMASTATSAASGSSCVTRNGPGSSGVAVEASASGSPGRSSSAC